MPERGGSMSVRVAQLVYRASLRALPGELRARYGREMQHEFTRIADEARLSRGVMSVWSVLVKSVFDVMTRAPSERRFERRLEAARNVQSTYVPLGERMLRFLNDLRVAARTLSRRPGFSFVVMITLALGIGANIAIFAVVNAVLIKPLPYPESSQIVALEHHAPGLDLPDLENSPGSIQNYATNAKTFSAVAAWNSRHRNLTGQGEPEQIEVAEVTAGIFDVLKVNPFIGRRLIDADTSTSAPAVAVLTYPGWVKYFGGERGAVGKSIQLDGVTTQIVGIMPKGYAYPSDKTMALLPMRIDYSEGYGSFGIGGLARLAPGVTFDAAQAEVDRLQRLIPKLDDDMNEEFLKKSGWHANAVPLRDRVVKDAAKTLWIVLGTVGFLLLVACASVANLFLVRAEGRRREVGVRFALGATRGRVASTFISESIILGVAGGAWGMLIAYFAVRGLVAAAPPQLPRLNEIGIDARVILFGAAISIIAGIIFGILPLPHRMSRPLADLVRGGRGQTDGRDRQSLRKILIVAQIALALMLLVGSGLMLRSFNRLRAVDPGINPEGVLTMGVSIGKVTDRAAAARLYSRMVDEIASLPGVKFAGATNSLPIEPKGLNGGSFSVRSAPKRADDEMPPVAMYVAVSGGFFEAMGTPVLQGRSITDDDVEHARNVVVVNETFANGFLKGRALDEAIQFGDDTTLWLTVVGVIKDVRTFGLSEEIKPMAYMPLSAPVGGLGLSQVTLALRTTGDPALLTASMRNAIHRVEPNLPVTTARTMTEVVKHSTAETSLTMTILALAATVALLLGAIGLYGVIGYVVTQRTKEIGVRIALGAMPGKVGGMILRQGMVLAVAGVVVGLIGAYTLSRVMASILFEIDPRDPLTFAVVPIVLLGVSALAAYLPARKAAGVSPMEALRSD